MRRSYWPAEPLRPGNSPRLKAQAMVCNRGRIEHVANPPTILPLGDSAEPVGAFHDSANLTCGLGRRAPCVHQTTARRAWKFRASARILTSCKPRFDTLSLAKSMLLQRLSS
jgi:hypothetical protein